ncbi:scavenger receptor cysteine-rich type 1 protein M130-like isoform X2 [Narcine bancroftii]|uniref:scavenger receptor cysteine-rich type 1 protein M130-like isoform X2 n=1 Tax=Narcine bancroftii TaxID=1343680 RepID=UPI003831079C
MIWAVLLTLVAFGTEFGCTSQDLKVRLVNGTDRCSGRVEVHYNGSWGTVCDDYWDMPDVVVVCYQLGCGFASKAQGLARHGQGSEKIWLDDVQCLGSESSLGECSYKPMGKHNCNHREDASAVCHRDHPPKPTMLLSRVAIDFIKGEDLIIQCISMGLYSNVIFYLFKNDQGTPLLSKAPSSRGQSASFLLSKLRPEDAGNYSCSYEVNLAGQRHTSNRSDPFTVNVKDQLPSPVLRVSMQGKVLLVGQEVNLICEAPNYFTGCHYHLHKRGEEDYIRSQVAHTRSIRATFKFPEVMHEDQGNYSCTYRVEIAGQTFNSTESPDVTIEVMDDLDVQLVDGENDCSGTVQVYFNSTWGSVCSQYWDLADAQVVCRDLGCGFAQSFAAEADGVRNVPLSMSLVRCSGAERHLWLCPARAWNEQVSCDRGSPAQVNCAVQPPPPNLTIYETKMFFKGDTVNMACSVHSMYKGAKMFLYKKGGAQLRLSNGPNACSGRVEYNYNGTWGSICASSWDILDAHVVCRQLGCGFGLSVAAGGHFGEGTGPLLLDLVHCSGAELTLWFCSAQWMNIRTCRAKNDAAVICTDQPQRPEINLLRNSRSFAQGETVMIKCMAPSYLTGGTFHLQKDSDPTWVRTATAEAEYFNVTFVIEDINTTQSGSYRCMYQLQREGTWYNSSLSDRVWVTVIEQPGQPVIHLFRNPPSYTLGEYVSIRCVAPPFYMGAFFFLRKVGASEAMFSRLSAGSSTTFQLGNVSKADGGGYTCFYQLKRSGSLYNSTESEPVRVSVTDSLRRPVLMVLRASATFVLGENVKFRCSASSQFAEITFYLYKVGESGPLNSSGPSSASSSILLLTNISNIQESFYTCMFKVVIGNQFHLSTHSDRVKITISSFTERPTISVKVPFSTYPQGQTIVFVCKAPKHYKPSDFQLYKGNAVQATRVELLSALAQFSILNVSMADAGNYSCMYQNTVGNWQYNSSLSDPLSISVAETMEQRLMNGSNRCAGRVEVLFGDEWGTVCDDHWGLPDAQVVCRSLGCGRAVKATTHASFGRGIGRIWLDDVACRADEPFLWNCASRFWGQHNCHHGEDAGVVCSGIKPTLLFEPNYHIFMKGEVLNVKCDVGSRDSSRGIDFFKNGSHLVHRELKQGVTSAVIPLANLSSQDVGNYSCIFQDQVSGTSVNSSQSDLVFLDVIDPLQKPKIDVIKVGEQTVINCTVQNMFTNGTMYLLELRTEGTRQVQWMDVSNASSIFTLNQTAHTAKSRYVCLYQVKMSGRSLNSTYTEAVRLSNAASTAKSIAGWFFAVLVVLLILAAAVFYFRKANSSKGKREYRIYVRERLLDDVTHIEAIEDDAPF